MSLPGQGIRGDIVIRPLHAVPIGPTSLVLNIHARDFFNRLVRPMATGLSRAGVTPDAITVFGTVGAVTSALVLFPRGDFFGGTLLVWAFVMLDIVDGAVARVSGRSSSFGAVLDVLTPGASTAYDLGAFRAAFAVQYVFWAIGLAGVLHNRRRLRTARNLQLDPFPRAVVRVWRRNRAR